MASRKPVKKAEREDPTIKETVRTKYIPYIDNLVVSKFEKRYRDADSVEKDWRKGYHTSDNIDRFLITFSEKFIQELCTHDSFFRSPIILNPLIRNISEYLSVYFIRTGQFEKRGDAKNYIRKTLTQGSAFIKKNLNEVPKVEEFELEKPRKFRQGAKTVDKIVSMDVIGVFEEAKNIRNTASAERRRRMGKS